MTPAGCGCKGHFFQMCKTCAVKKPYVVFDFQRGYVWGPGHSTPGQLPWWMPCEAEGDRSLPRFKVEQLLLAEIAHRRERVKTLESRVMTGAANREHGSNAPAPSTPGGGSEEPGTSTPNASVDPRDAEFRARFNAGGVRMINSKGEVVTPSSCVEAFIAEVRHLKARCITELITLDRAASQNWTHERRGVWSTVERELDRILRMLPATQKGGADGR